MTPGARVARGVALRALVAIAGLAAGAVLAQDPRAGAAQHAAREWLAQTDKLDAVASYDAAGARFRAPIGVEQWTEALGKARAPLGALVQRTVVETAFDKGSPDGGPEVEIAVIRYRTAFAQKTVSSETVTLELEKDGAWRVIGYFIR
jgi:hypothetical protein